MKLLRLVSRPVSLREAAATIFALSAILPLLVLVYVGWRLGLLVQPEAQVGLTVALLLALAGFWISRRMAHRISSLALTIAAPPAAGSAPESVAIATVPGLGPVTEVNQIAEAFARLLQELRASTERLEDLVFKLGTLNDMVELAARIPKISDLLGLVLERTMRTVGAAIGSIMLLDRDGQTLRIAASRGLPDNLAGVEVKIGEGIAGKVAKLGEPVLVQDIEADSRFAKTNDPKYGDRSFISAPIRVGDRIIGVVNLSKKQYGPVPSSGPTFSFTDLQFLNALMTYIAYAVDNARLLEEARQSAVRLQEVVEDQQLRLTLAQQQMLQAAKLSALGQLVAGVAHELNNPLTVLLSAGQLLLTEDMPRSARARLQLMYEAAQRARRIVRDLLTFARRESPERRRVDLVELLEKVLTIAEADLQLARVTVERQVGSHLPALWADGDQLQQVLLNLITNAKQAMGEVDGERRLHLNIQCQGADQIRILVEDTGPGIPAELLPKIFDPFVTTKGARGTGLGLSISYGIVQEHGGQLSVESVHGRGTTFIIDLPVGTPDSRPSEPSSPSLPLAGRRVIVVEDDQAVQDLVRTYLDGAGCITVGVRSAEDALKRLEEPVDVIVSDLYLPGMDGLAFYREATARHPNLARTFLLMTGGVTVENSEGFPTEARGRLLKKPFSRDQLLNAVAEVLGPSVERVRRG